MAELVHGSGKTLQVDSENVDLLANYTWKEDRQGFFYARIGNKTMYLHRIVGGRSIGFANHTVRVRFRDASKKEDCRLSNLDVTDYAQQNQQRQMAVKKTSRYRGVYWWEKKQRWRAREYLHTPGQPGRPIHIGLYTDETEAARARDAWCRVYKPEAILNFPDKKH